MKQGCRIKHSGFSTADCSALMSTQSHKVCEQRSVGLSQTCHVSHAETRARFLNLLCAGICLACPGQRSGYCSSSQVHSVQSRWCWCVLALAGMHLWETWWGFVEKILKLCWNKISCWRKRRGEGRPKCAVLPALGCDLMCTCVPHWVRTSLASGFRTEFLKDIYKAAAKLCLVRGVTECIFVGYSDWKLAVNLKLKFLELSAYFHKWHAKTKSATSMNCGGFTVLLDKLTELTLEQDPSTLSCKSHLSEVMEVHSSEGREGPF